MKNKWFMETNQVTLSIFLKILFLFIGMLFYSPAFPSVVQKGTTISGKVVDEQGESLPGVNITVVGSTRGVATDLDGTFQINVSSEDKLSVSFLGMQDQEIPIKGKKELLIIMKPKTDELEEVTVVAFSKQKKESVLASISTVKPGDLKIPSSNLTTALAGRIAGLISYQRTGEPGQDDATFFVRGVTSLTYAKGPLILIDGVEMSSSDLARLQPDDIASFSIMKDATATALYGARGANGVILVTTKEGKEGPATITVRYETSISKPTKDVNFADPITYMELNNEAVLTRNPLDMAPYSREKIDNTIKGKNSMVYPRIDWKENLLKNQTLNHRVNFNLSGGGKIARYYIAATFNQDNGIMKMDKRNNFNNNIDLKRYLLRSNVNINVTKTTEAVVRLHGAFDDYSGPLDGGSDLYKKIMRTNPVLFPPFYIPDEYNKNTKHILFGNYDKGKYLNPYADMVKGYKEYSKTTMLAQFELKQKLDFITEGLNVRGLFSTTRYSYFDVSRAYSPFYYSVGGYDKYEDSYTLLGLNPTTGTDYLTYSPGTKQVTASTYFEGAINYDRTFDEKHGVSGLLVFTARNSLDGGASSLTQSLPQRNLGISGRFTYDFDTRYFSEFNFGYNGSERFAKNERFGFFPSVGVGWIVSNENFWGKGLSQYINMLKLKGTYGLVGNDAIGNTEHRFFYLSEVNMDNSSFGTDWGDEYGYHVNGISISKYPNELITWEKSTKVNLGVETRLFNMVDFQADYYTEKRTNILQTRSYLPTTMGLMATPQSNLGVAKAKGLDLSVDIQKVFNKDWWLSGRLNFTYSKSKYTEYEDIDKTDTPWLSHIGRPVSQQWGFVAERLFVDEEEVANSPVQFGDYMAGDIKYRDIDGDGKITDEDKVPIGYPTEPEIVYGFGFSTGYKAFDFSCFFQGLGRESFWIDVNATAPFVSYTYDDTEKNSGIIYQNQLLQAYAKEHWSEDNRNIYALWPRLSGKVIENNAKQSSWFMRDGSFMRLKSLEIGYSLNEQWIKRLYLKNCRLYFSGTNLLTFSNFKMWDPEMAGNGLAYPTQKVYNIGIQVTF
ncbi:SusC/RagA family TonB-linked outer membrane protein [Parabacteroides sp. Marseille-P3160]|uniref:SusC/RagA family TonB-linked outer membrane protein n=1 Tax=Parabacteroides sp. Marseille-P3160 TaxID=1917887 RepID=UPI00350F8603